MRRYESFMKQLLLATIFLMSATWLFALDQLHPIPVVDQVDVIEVNHFYDENGKLVFDQLIYYDWNRVDCRYDIVAWQLLKDQVMDRDGVIWWDTKLHRVRTKIWRESWTQYDPELQSRESFPACMRRGLR